MTSEQFEQLVANVDEGTRALLVELRAGGPTAPSSGAAGGPTAASGPPTPDMPEAVKHAAKSRRSSSRGRNKSPEGVK